VPCWLYGFPAAVRFYVRAGQTVFDFTLEIRSFAAAFQCPLSIFVTVFPDSE
jgi:hypothetical protein